MSKSLVQEKCPRIVTPAGKGSQGSTVPEDLDCHLRYCGTASTGSNGTCDSTMSGQVWIQATWNECSAGCG